MIKKKFTIYHLPFTIYDAQSGPACWQAGQTLLEVLVALGIAIVIASAIVVAVIFSLNNEQFGISQNQSTHLAQEGLDIFRNLSQTDWNKLAGYNSVDYCLPQVSNPIPSPKPGIAPWCIPSAGNFVREIKFEPNLCIFPTPATTLNVKVTSSVRWTDGKCLGTGDLKYCHQVQLVSCMFKPLSSSTP